VDGIRPELQHLIRRIEVFEEIDSTNDELLRRPPGGIHGRVVLAERQSAGKGRRGRRWQSPAGNIFLSIGWHFVSPPRALDGLPLVVGVCLCRALARIGVKGHRVKQPNDILVDGAKLCGILVETRGGQSDRDTVTGIGLNVQLDDDSGDMIDQPWTDLQRLLGDELPSRNEMVSTILEELLPRFQDERGMSAFLADAWPDWDLSGG
jgi:BirA family biotin operon repressor/biotin-[acetyl-CoA-carboxylase] ligase